MLTCIYCHIISGFTNYQVGPEIDPCGTTEVTGCTSENSPSWKHTCFLLNKYHLNQSSYVDV